VARLAFFGTPALAVPTLDALLARAGAHDVVCVVCQPDKPKGRGQKLEAPPTKERALAAGVPVLQPSTLKQGTPDGDAFFARLSTLAIDLAVVIAYGRIIPRRVLALPTRGFVNLHASLLPRWRGAAPIQRAIEAGDRVTGVCLMDMIYELDAGDVFTRVDVPIADDDDGESLADKIAHAAAALLARDLDALLAGALARTPQPSEGVTYASMLSKEDGVLRFDKDARAVACQARAMTPWPGAQARVNDEPVKLFGARVVDAQGAPGAPGTVIASDDALVVACANGAVAFSEI
jgi:methionyl-tRNA formyltransferase